MAQRPGVGAPGAQPGAEKADPNVHQIVQSISCHAWNQDRTQLAVCPNNNEVHIYALQGGEWFQIQVLKEHDQLVTGIDWGHKSNRIVTCGQDRNAYVWRYENDMWKPTLVILRINRAATDVKWSPEEDKFAVASGAKCVSVCYFEKDNDWWVSKHIKKHKSTVTRIDWHPNNVLLATSSTDCFARVFSGFIKGVDKRPGETAFGSRLPFGELLAEYPAAGWVHSVKWSPSGNSLAFTGHDSTLNIIDTVSGDVTVLRLKELPLIDLIWANENLIIGAGHNMFPRTFERGADGFFKIGKNLDEQKVSEGNKAVGTRAAFNMFQSKVEVGQNDNVTKLNTKHQNYVSYMKPCVGAPGNWTRISTSGLDGKIVFWDV